MNDHKRILILGANPWDTTRLRLHKEVREIRNVIKSSKLRDQISIEDRGAVQPEDLQQELLDVDPHILHFCGHSDVDGLIVEDESVGSTTVNPEAFASLLEIWSEEEAGASKIECVILNSCYSGSIARVICQHVEYVIGMHQGISDAAAIEFAKGFYRGLGAGKSIETAFKLGCSAIQLKNIPEHLTPVLMHDCSVIRGRAEEYSPTVIFDTDSPRLQALWRLAYAFLRLDQLPSGGWSKTLSTWMDMIWEGDRGTIPRNPGMRKVGGTDLTVCAFHTYCSFLMRLFSPARVARLLQNSGSADRVYDNLAERIGWNGALGTSQWTRDSEVPRVRIRHTLMGLMAFLLYGKVNQFTRNIQSDLDSMYQYLFKSIKDWRYDESYLFGMLSAATKLNEMLSKDVAKRQLSEEQRESLQNLLAVYIPQMAQEVNRPLAYNPRPEGTIGSPLRASMFHPYNRFWRMERSGFLMYFPFLVTDDGKAFLKHVDQGLQMRCAQIFSQLLDNIAHPYDDREPSRSLIRYHRDSGIRSSNQYDAPRDWGLSAELAALLNMKVVRDLLIQNELVDAETYDQKKNALFAALLETFDWYHKNPKIFRFTHGSSFGKILHLLDREIIKPVELGRLDKAISKLCTEGITEQGILALIKDKMIADTEEKAEVNLRALKDMLVVKLESGEYTPDDVICRKDEWKQRIQHVVNHSTIDFYESELANRHIERYGSNPRLDFVPRLEHILDDWTSDESRIALDVGCGPGQYAELLVKMGFEVKLLDASKRMLELACARLGIPKDSFSATNILDTFWGYPDSYFDLVFACAIMIHVPKEQAKKIYQTFYRLLKPRGVLFVSFKIGDHTLISEDGRFFEYYRHESLLWKELESVGFRVEGVIKTTNYRDMYDSPRQITWANFYCKKEEN